MIKLVALLFGKRTIYSMLGSVKKLSSISSLVQIVLALYLRLPEGQMWRMAAGLLIAKTLGSSALKVAKATA
jgi:hypothetical protein